MWPTPADHWNSALSGQEESQRNTLHRFVYSGLSNHVVHIFFWLISELFLTVTVLTVLADRWREETGVTRSDACVWQKHLQYSQISDLLYRLLHHRYVWCLGWYEQHNTSSPATCIFTVCLFWLLLGTMFLDIWEICRLGLVWEASEAGEEMRWSIWPW